MKNICNQRLLRFADHLANINNHPEQSIHGVVTLVALEERVRIPYKVIYLHWVFEELPIIFDDWYYAEKWGNPMWEGSEPSESTPGAVIDFFELSLDEFGHLFDLEGFQDVERYGGKLLTMDAKGPDIALNIRELVKSRN